ncbi:hypothetical protein [Mesorhizobium japonicum]|uniref:hypothetical protein n=1 Tax=Mesorhizobium japonicum TaxID=2066070 RepID=UPI003B5C4C2A
MSELEPRERDTDRLASSAARYEDRIDAGLAAAMREKRELDVGVVRLIARVVGRALGRQSAFAEFARSGEGDFKALSPEYLEIYNDPSTPATVRHWLDWLGTYFVHTAETAAIEPANETRSLRRNTTSVRGIEVVFHAARDLSDADLEAIQRELELLDVDRDRALRAYLSLPDVDAGGAQMMERFHDAYAGEFSTIDEALYGLVELREWEKELEQWTAERGLLSDAASIDLDVIESQTRELYDFGKLEGTIYAFWK